MLNGNYTLIFLTIWIVTSLIWIDDVTGKRSKFPKNIDSKVETMLRDERSKQCNVQQCTRSDRTRRSYCGSDGRTFHNLCSARRAKCYDPMLSYTRGKCKVTKCLRARKHAIRKQQIMSRSSFYVPTCNSEGYYDVMQCNNDVDYCWCVTSEGKPIVDSVVKQSLGEPPCVNHTEGTRQMQPRSTKICPTREISPLLIIIANLALERHPEVSLLEAVTSLFKQIDEDSNNLVSSRELKKFLREIKSSECTTQLLSVCDEDSSRKVNRDEWNNCVVTAATQADEERTITQTTANVRIFVPGDSCAAGKKEILSKLETNLKKVYKRANTVTSSETVLSAAVMWNFNRLDVDHNSVLSLSEVESLRRKYRKKISRECFMKLCDTNNDENVTSSEWQYCFIKNEGHNCAAERLQTELRNDERQYIPECQAENPSLWEEVQCLDFTSYCWCTSPDTGRPISGTSRKNERPDCSNIEKGTRPEERIEEEIEEEFVLQLTGCKKPQIFLETLRTSFNMTTNDESDVTRFYARIDRNNDETINKKEMRKVFPILGRQKFLKQCLRIFAKTCDFDKNKKLEKSEFQKCITSSRLLTSLPITPPSNRGRNPLMVGDSY